MNESLTGLELHVINDRIKNFGWTIPLKLKVEIRYMT